MPARFTLGINATDPKGYSFPIHKSHIIVAHETR